MAMVITDASAATADAATKQPDAADKEYSSYNGASTAGGGAHRARGGGGVVDSVVARWRREDMLDKSPLALHAAAAAFAFVALVLLASNQHGDWMQFDRYQEYRCVRDSIRFDSSLPACLGVAFDPGKRLTCLVLCCFCQVPARDRRAGLRLLAGAGAAARAPDARRRRPRVHAVLEDFRFRR
jgi:hypothetical protein